MSKYFELIRNRMSARDKFRKDVKMRILKWFTQVVESMRNTR